MRTDDLIEALARDARTLSPGVGYRLGVFLAAGCGISLVLFALILGLRPDFWAALETPWYPLKIAVLALTASLALPVAESLARPGAQGPARWLVLAAAALAFAVTADLALLGSSGAPERMMGVNAFKCLIIVPLFAAAPLVATLAALRHGAPTSPVKAGLAAGLLSGAIGGVLYGLFCPDDSPLFVALWYSIAIALVSLAGAAMGRLTLRW